MSSEYEASEVAYGDAVEDVSDWDSIYLWILWYSVGGEFELDDNCSSWIHLLSVGVWIVVVCSVVL